jgi:hypothetical protein
MRKWIFWTVVFVAVAGAVTALLAFEFFPQAIGELVCNAYAERTVKESDEYPNIKVGDHYLVFDLGTNQYRLMTRDEYKKTWVEGCMRDFLDKPVPPRIPRTGRQYST